MTLSAEKKVGTLFFLGLALLAVFAIVLTDIRLFRKQYRIIVTFDQVGGLKTGDKATLDGMEVGSVKSLAQSKGQIEVVLALDERVEIPRNSVFRLGDIGLLGGKLVDIVSGDEDSGFLADGERIKGENSPGLSEAIAILGEAGANVDRIMVSLRELIEKISRGEGTVGRLINDDDIYRDIRVISDRIASGQGTIGKLITEDDLYTDARATLISVDTTGQKVSDMLAKVERVRIFLGAEFAYNVRNEHSLAKAYVEIEPTPSKLYRVGFSLLGGEGTEADRTDDPSTELDVQIGLRFFDNHLTVRGGLLEGRIGGGLDFRIWGEDLVLTVEGRDVWSKEKDENIDPFLLRAYIDTKVWWGFYLRLGGDNLLDEPGFYGGVGLKLRDDDIKALFGLINF